MSKNTNELKTRAPGRFGLEVSKLGWPMEVRILSSLSVRVAEMFSHRVITSTESGFRNRRQLGRSLSDVVLRDHTYT